METNPQELAFCAAVPGYTPNTQELHARPCHQVEVTGDAGHAPTGVLWPSPSQVVCRRAAASRIQQQTQAHHVSIIFIQVQR